MEKIRSAVFETNSSSTHSISISTENTDLLLDTSLQPDKDGNIVLIGGDFGWGIEDFYDAQTKASYIAVWSNVHHGGKYDDTIIEVICNQTAASNVIFSFEDSYIDHQSSDNEYDYICEDKETLRHFIFNRNSFLHLDNDNH